MADKPRSGVTPGAIKRTYLAEGGALVRGTGLSAGTSEDQVKLVTGAAVRCVGVAEESVSAAGDPVSVVLYGPCVAIAGGQIVRGDRVKNAVTTGRFVAGNAADVETVGFALGMADADGDEFIMFVQPIHKRA